MTRIYRIILSAVTVALVLGMNASYAEEHPFVPHMARALKIKLANDGKGIIEDVICTGCKFSVVNITPETKAYRNGVEVNLLEAKMRAGKPTLVSFNPETREVQTIRWNE